jgi:hypothetical protein
MSDKCQCIAPSSGKQCRNFPKKGSNSPFCHLHQNCPPASRIGATASAAPMWKGLPMEQKETWSARAKNIAKDDIFFHLHNPQTSESIQISESTQSTQNSQSQKPNNNSLCEQLTQFNKTVYDLSSLICTQMSKQENWPDLLALMAKCKPASECDPCTTIGYKIASSLVKIASVRIFAEPEQSIVELLVNSLDAYYPENKIGKFGMGFFSTLYWIVGHPNRELNINVTLQDCEYVLTIWEADGRLVFKLQTQKKKEKTHPSTKVTINANIDKFTSSEVKAFKKQANKLRFVSYPNLKLHDKTDYSYGRIPDYNEIVYTINSNELTNYDEATGIPLEILLGSLLVPSISTKGLQIVRTDPNFINRSRINVYGKNKNTFIILVGGIAVISIEKENPPTSTIGGNRNEYILDMPRSTRLPVSRDDIILTPTTAKIMKEGLKILMNSAIKELKTVDEFQTLLQDYVDYTPSIENRMVIKSFLDEFYEDNKGRLVPVKYMDLYKVIEKLYKPDGANRFVEQQSQFEFIGSNNYDEWEIEKLLDKHITYNQQIWYGYNVVIDRFPNYQITNGGLIKYLFVDTSYVAKLGLNWKNTITISYTNSSLHQFGTKFGKSEYEKYDLSTWSPMITQMTNILDKKIIDRINSQAIRDDKNIYSFKLLASKFIIEPDILDHYFVVLSKFDKINQVYFSNNDADFYAFQKDLLILYIVLDTSDLHKIFGTLLTKLDSFKGIQTYGGESYYFTAKYELMIELAYINELYAIPDIIESVKSKILSFLPNHIVANIQSIREQPGTRRSLVNGYSPGSMARNFMNYFNVGNKAEGANILNPIVKLSENLPEYNLLLSTIGKVIMDKKIINIGKSYFSNLIIYLLTDIRKRRLNSQLNLVQTYTIWDNSEFPDDGETPVYFLEYQSFVTKWISSFKDIQIPYVVEKRNKAVVTFSLSKLIKTVFKKDIPDLKTSTTNIITPATMLLDLFQTVVNDVSTDPLPLQIVEIAINEGTVKPFIEASLTELVQNSIDAIRTSHSVSDDMDIDIDLIRTHDDKSIILRITDYVGMSPESFLYVAIPFISTKTASQIQTGEMGSGFFNVYRESSSVSIVTAKNGLEMSYYDVPVRGSDDRVIDIIKEFSYKQSEPRAHFTTIEITIPINYEGRSPNITDVAFVKIVSDIEFYCRNVIGLAQSEGNINFMGTTVNVPKIKVSDVGDFEIYMIVSKSDQLTISNTKDNPNINSYLLTKGIPFAPLKGYLSDMKETLLLYTQFDCLVNIKHGGYTPVQTRTRINMNPKTLADLETVKWDIAFLAALRSYRDGIFVLDNTRSQAQAKDIKFFINTNRNTWYMPADVLNNTSYKGAPSLASLINDCIDIMGDRLFKDAEADIEKRLKKYDCGYKAVNYDITYLARQWLLHKNINKPFQPKGVIKKSDRKRLAEFYKRLGSVVERWITNFWIIAQKTNIVGFNADDIPQVEIVEDFENNYWGWYNRSIHTITVNVKDWNTENTIQIINILDSGTVLTPEILLKLDKNNKVWADFFGYHFPATVMAHEIEHVRRGNDRHGDHDSIQTELYHGDKPQTRTFSESANAVYNKVLANGFYDKSPNLWEVSDKQHRTAIKRQSNSDDDNDNDVAIAPRTWDTILRKPGEPAPKSVPNVWKLETIPDKTDPNVVHFKRTLKCKHPKNVTEQLKYTLTFELSDWFREQINEILKKNYIIAGLEESWVEVKRKPQQNQLKIDSSVSNKKIDKPISLSKLDKKIDMEWKFLIHLLACD